MASLASSAQAAAVPLGTAANFAVLEGSTVTNAGPSVISGASIGVSPGSAVTGFGPGTVLPPSTIYRGGSVALQAKNDLTAAYDNVAARSSSETIFADLAGRTLEPGVYSATSSLALNGDLTLDAKGDPNAVFVFQVGSTLLVGTTTVSSVRLIGGAPPWCAYAASLEAWRLSLASTVDVLSPGEALWSVPLPPQTFKDPERCLGNEAALTACYRAGRAWQQKLDAWLDANAGRVLHPGAALMAEGAGRLPGTSRQTQPASD